MEVSANDPGFFAGISSPGRGARAIRLLSNEHVGDNYVAAAEKKARVRL